MIVRGIPRESRSVPDSLQAKKPSSRGLFCWRLQCRAFVQRFPRRLSLRAQPELPLARFQAQNARTHEPGSPTTVMRATRTAERVNRGDRFSYPSGEDHEKYTD